MATSASKVQQQDFPRAESSSHRASDVLEATELSRIRTNYSRATAAHHEHAASNSITRRPPTGLWKLKYAITKFWNNQISVIVAHEACRDHLGMYAIQSLIVSLDKDPDKDYRTEGCFRNLSYAAGLGFLYFAWQSSMTSAVCSSLVKQDNLSWTKRSSVHCRNICFHILPSLTYFTMWSH